MSLRGMATGAWGAAVAEARHLDLVGNAIPCQCLLWCRRRYTGLRHADGLFAAQPAGQSWET